MAVGLNGITQYGTHPAINLPGNQPWAILIWVRKITNTGASVETLINCKGDPAVTPNLNSLHLQIYQASSGVVDSRNKARSYWQDNAGLQKYMDADEASDP